MTPEERFTKLEEAMLVNASSSFARRSLLAGVSSLRLARKGWLHVQPSLKRQGFGSHGKLAVLICRGLVNVRIGNPTTRKALVVATRAVGSWMTG